MIDKIITINENTSKDFGGNTYSKNIKALMKLLAI